MHEGLSEDTAVGRVGAYRPGVWTEYVQLGTVIANGHGFFSPGDPTREVLSLAVGPDYSRQHLGSSWTGRSWRYAGEHGIVDLHLRTTLPGPLFSHFEGRLGLRFGFGHAPEVVEDLESGRTLKEFRLRDPGRVLLLRGPYRPMLLVASRPIRQYEAISHEHLWLTFDEPDARVMWVPLLDDGDIPAEAARLDLWRALIDVPPMTCEETYEVQGETVRIRERFASFDGTAPRLVPLPPVPALLADRGGIQDLPRGTMLCKTLIGPYRLVQGDSFDWTIDTGWMDAEIEATRKVEGPLAAGLSPVPEELVYAGDVSWEPGTPMDQLLSLRVWAQLADLMPADLWARLRPMLAPPTPAAFRESLFVLDEPFTGQRWAKDKGIFAERNEISYDSDWYNGLTLSGLWRGMRCADGEIAAACHDLSREVKRERGWLADCMWVCHDWALGSAWSDPRGELIDFDCSHNGLEGLLAEMKMRRLEGDAGGAERMQYLAAKTSLIFLANFELADWCRDVGFTSKDDGGLHLGISHLYERRGVRVDTATTRAPYALAGNWPEFAALLRLHGPFERIREMAAEWKANHPARYEDWDYFSTRGRHDALQTGRQGSRTQNAVMYHLAPEICTRLWVLDEDPDEVEGMYGTPVNLAEQLWCRCGARLKREVRKDGML